MEVFDIATGDWRGGLVARSHARSGRHVIIFDDGRKEQLSLKQLAWRFARTRPARAGRIAAKADADDAPNTQDHGAPGVRAFGQGPLLLTLVPPLLPPGAATEPIAGASKKRRGAADAEDADDGRGSRKRR